MATAVSHHVHHLGRHLGFFENFIFSKAAGNLPVIVSQILQASFDYIKASIFRLGKPWEGGGPFDPSLERLQVNNGFRS